MTQVQAAKQQGTRTQRDVGDDDPNSIEAFAKRLISQGFVVSERGKEARQPTLQEAMLVAHAARTYDLDPLMGEVSILGAKLYTNLAGVRKCARKIARRDGRRYCEVTRPATQDEAAAAFIAEGEHYWIADIVIDGGEETFRGHGFASQQNVSIAAIWRDRQLVGYDPRVIRNMAENRAVRRALVAAFGLPFADPEDAGKESQPEVGLTAVQPPTSGTTEVYPAIPQKATVTIVLSEEAEKVPAERARTAPVSYPAPAQAPVTKGAKAPAKHAWETVPPDVASRQKAKAPDQVGAQPPITQEEAEEILRREAAEAAMGSGG